MSQRLAWSHSFAQVGAERPPASRRTRVLESQSPTITRLATPIFLFCPATHLPCSVSKRLDSGDADHIHDLYVFEMVDMYKCDVFVPQTAHSLRCDT
jgi:flavin reductase (DIM6/NTAB) family NADH-FMN oxidoreductase RutF